MPRKNNNARVVAGKPRRSAAVTETTTPTRTAAEDKLWEALRAHPGMTTAELATQAKIGKSTAGKILPAWNADGSIERTSGAQSGGRRGADRWTIPAADKPVDADSPTGPDDGEACAAEASAVGTPTDAPPSPVDVDGTPPAVADPADTTAKAPRLGKGALRGMVEDYLRAHPGEEFSPNAIGTALGRSSGAVNNALEKLVTDGYAVRTQDKPKRFALKPDK